MAVTLDPSNKSYGLTLSNGNLTAARDGGDGVVRATEGKTSGKWYWEVTVQTLYIAIGITPDSISTSNFAIYNTPGSTGLYTHSGVNTVGYAPIPAFASGLAIAEVGDTYGVCLDMDNKTFSLLKNGSLGLVLKKSLTALGISASTLYAALNVHDTGGLANINFGGTTFKFPVPYGYNPYDTTAISSHRKERVSVGSMNVGDVISCEYTAASGVAGSFANLGAATKSCISPISSATPNGSFNFVYIGEDYLGRKKLVADRNIQHSISWDNLNKAGLCTGKTIVIDNLSKDILNVRLLTGGSPSDTDNEWDQLMVQSTLNGNITAGDIKVWSLTNRYSWTSTTNYQGSTYRTVRGYNNVTVSDFVTSDNYNVTWGFRPILIVEVGATSKYLIKDGNVLYKVISGTRSVVRSNLNTVAISASDFLSDGMESLSGVTNSHITDLTAPKILYYKV